MNIATLRQTLKNYLSSHLRIDQWGVGMPANISDQFTPPSIAIDEPGKFEETGFFQGQGSPTPVVVAATLPFQIIYRFNSVYKYDELPRGELEAKLMELRTILRQSIGCNIDDVLPGSFKTSGSVAIAQQENKDWLLICKFTVMLSLLSERQDISFTSSLFAAVGSDAPVVKPPTKPLWAASVLTIGSYGQTIFMLSKALAYPESSELYLEGEKFAYGRDYSISGSTLTWLSAVRLDPVYILELFFIVSAASQSEVSDILFVTTVGQTVFTLSQAPLYPGITELFVEGEKFGYGRDYLINGTTLTWLSIVRLEPSYFIEISYVP